MEQAPSERGTPPSSLALWPESPDSLPDTRCRFDLQPPRHFLYPALLLLVAEEPRHGYVLVEALEGFGLGTIDRASVYRALGQLERDELVSSSDAPPTAGTTRHVYNLTDSGRQALQAWMSTIAREHASLDSILRRYWYCSASWPPLAEADPSEDEKSSDHTVRRFVVASDRSHLVVEARSNVGPIAFTTKSLSGELRAAVNKGLLAVEPQPTAHLSARMSDLSSGNTLYDNELLRRVDARRYPLVQLELHSTSQVGEGNCYQLSGDVTLHGETRPLDGLVNVTIYQEPSPDGADSADSVDSAHHLAGLASAEHPSFRPAAGRSSAPPAVAIPSKEPGRLGGGGGSSSGGSSSGGGRGGSTSSSENAHAQATGTSHKPEQPRPNHPTPHDRMLTVRGEQVFDIRRFGMSLPEMPLLRLYPDVRLYLHLEADAVD